MKLLQPAEREMIAKAEDARQIAKANELSNHITQVTKEYNQTLDRLSKKEQSLFANHQKLVGQLETEIEGLENKAKPLRVEIERGLLPLKSKESEIANREKIVKREEERWGAVELEVIDLRERKADLELNQKRFEKFKEGQKELLKQNKDKLREWFENQQYKLKNAK